MYRLKRIMDVLKKEKLFILEFPVNSFLLNMKGIEEDDFCLEYHFGDGDFKRLIVSKELSLGKINSDQVSFSVGQKTDVLDLKNEKSLHSDLVIYRLFYNMHVYYFQSKFSMIEPAMNFDSADFRNFTISFSMS